MSSTGDARARRAGPLRLLPPALVAAGAAAAVALVALVDPNVDGHYPVCPFLTLTGLYCPGCGGLRAVHALTHGDVGTAFALNPFVVVLIPVAVYLWGRWTWAVARRSRPRDPLLTVPAAVVLLVAVVVFGIVRNLPFGQALAP